MFVAATSAESNRRGVNKRENATTQFKVASGRPLTSYQRKCKCFSQSLLSDDIGTQKRGGGGAAAAAAVSAAAAAGAGVKKKKP